MTAHTFLNGRVQLHAGDCLEILPTLPENSVDSVCTDPPYHLASIVKRFGADGAAPAKSNGATGVYERATAGFMGKQWDGGDIAFRPETWVAVLRVLKPGGHMVAFAAPKNAHRMICAIEDAGFEIRDTLMWLFGSGFPKGLDVSKAIDKAAGAERIFLDAPTGGLHGGSGNTVGKFTGRQTVAQGTTEAARQWEGWNVALKPAYEPIALCRKPLSEPTIAANVLRWSTGALNIGACRIRSGDEQSGSGTHSGQGQNGARHGGDLLPGLHEGISHAERPSCAEQSHDVRSGLSCNSDERSIQSEMEGGPLPGRSGILACDDAGRVSSGASGYNGDGVGASASFDGGRASHQRGQDGQSSRELESLCGAGDAYNGKSCEQVPDDRAADVPLRQPGRRPGGFGNVGAEKGDKRPNGVTPPAGRWPANVLHDGSEEVVAAFPETGPATPRTASPTHHTGFATNFQRGSETSDYNDNGGSAARYFYTAKADSDDRIGSKHPTVKPLDLMQYLVRLVTPPRGVVLDLFAGTGTTGEAAWREGFSAILIEREPEYVADIERRMKLCLAGPDERARESIKARLKDKPMDAGPLFAPTSRIQVVCPECGGNPPHERGQSGWGCETCWSHGYIWVEPDEAVPFGSIV